MRVLPLFVPDSRFFDSAMLYDWLLRGGSFITRTSDDFERTSRIL
jgi:hypothetical protein